MVRIGYNGLVVDDAGDVTTDCANVYWTNAGTGDSGVTSAGSVMKLAKPQSLSV